MSKKILLWVVVGIVAIGAIILASLSAVRFETVQPKNNNISENENSALQQETGITSVSLSSLKFKEIKTDFPAIGAIAIYGNEIAFSCGSGKIKPNMPTSSNINNIVVYDTKNGKIEFSKEISKNWLMIGDIYLNDNWILVRAIDNPNGSSVECFAINRKNKQVINLLQNYKDYGGFAVSHILLQMNYANIALEKSENGNKMTRLVRVNLDNGAVQTYFKKDSSSFAVYHLWPLQYDCIAFSAVETLEGGEIKQYLYRYSFTGKSSDCETLPDYIYSYIVTSDEYIVYPNISGKIVIAPLTKPDEYEEIGLHSPDITSFADYAVASQDYIAVKLIDGSIFVFNRKTKNRIIIKGTNENSEIVLNGSKLCVINRPENTSDSIIHIDLKENGF
jgi:hypothetical protein